MAKVKDKFRDWNLYHKSIIAGLAAFVLSMGVKAYFALDAAYEMRSELVIAAAPADIWPWVIGNSKRPDWQSEVIRVQGLSHEVGRRRLLFWHRGYENWRSSELTTGLVQERLFRTEQESDVDTRWFEVALTPLGACETKVVLTEVLQPTLFSDRFWFFRVKDQRQARLTTSLKALSSWVNNEHKACPSGQ